MTLNIGTTIKNLRTKKQITQKQLATYLGVTEQAISRWESGGGFPDIQLLPAIASYFSVSTDMLLGIDMSEREVCLAEIRRKIDDAVRDAAACEVADAARAAIAEALDQYSFPQSRGVGGLTDPSRTEITVSQSGDDTTVTAVNVARGQGGGAGLSDAVQSGDPAWRMDRAGPRPFLADAQERLDAGEAQAALRAGLARHRML